MNKTAPPWIARWRFAFVVGVAAVSGAGCGGAKDGEKPALQAVAKVNKEEITVHQVNAVLAQQRSATPEVSEAVQRRALERLIEQELAVQKAAELKIDRDPRVVQTLEAARREIIARAYAEKLSESTPKPDALEIRRYYETHPALFAERRVYQLQEFAVKAQPTQVDALRERVKTVRNAAEFAEYLRSNQIEFAVNQSVQAAEQLPMAALPDIVRLKDGQGTVFASASGVSAVFVVGSRLQPVDEVRASKAIEQFLHNERKRKTLSDDMKELRRAAKVEYLGKFAGAAPPDEPAVSLSPAAVAASAAAVAASSADHVRPASASDVDTFKKGLGLK